MEIKESIMENNIKFDVGLKSYNLQGNIGYISQIKFIDLVHHQTLLLNTFKIENTLNIKLI